MVHLICTFEPVRIPLLGQFVEHYFRIGVERFHLSVQIEPDLPVEQRTSLEQDARQALHKLGLPLEKAILEPFSSLSLRIHHDEIQAKYCTPPDWIVWADLDEFQVYPGDFRSLLKVAESFSIDYFRGRLIDRIAEDGTLPEFDPSQSIWRQYPRVVQPPSPISPSITQKVTCARSSVHVNRGNHFPVNEEPLRYYAETIPVHHFKWDATVKRRLTRRLSPDFAAVSSGWTESKTILEWIDAHDGAIGVI